MQNIAERESATPSMLERIVRLRVRRLANFNFGPGDRKFLRSRVWSSTREFRNVSKGWQIRMQMYLPSSIFTFAYETSALVESSARFHRGSRFSTLSGSSRTYEIYRSSVKNLVGSKSLASQPGIASVRQLSRTKDRWIKPAGWLLNR